jgi:hypothetical protein
MLYLSCQQLLREQGSHCTGYLYISLWKNVLQGIVQRKLAGVKNDINRKAFLFALNADIVFLNLKGTCCEKSVSSVFAVYPYQWGYPLQITDSRKSISRQLK